jgi:hypothetical protein
VRTHRAAERPDTPFPLQLSKAWTWEGTCFSPDVD